ncbi:Neurogenic locus Notch protein [Vespula maculifrons]|uniref:Neurogenic locus Notch protein n=1 Tax=Vespula maculifrons TaxID=7453 RepID=A0ABD2CWB1_VESMC
MTEEMSTSSRRAVSSLFLSLSSSFQRLRIERAAVEIAELSRSGISWRQFALKCELIRDSLEQYWNTQQRFCTSKYVGEYCQHLNPCHTGPRCQNGGSCRVREIIGGGTPSFTCSCPVGFTASLCEIPIDNACDSSPCLNGATCNLKSLYEYVCTCATGYTGEHCEREDYCASSPCRNGAECRSLEDSYKCTCASGFAGRNCADDIDECERNPCKHGTCKNIHGSYKLLKRLTKITGTVIRYYNPPIKTEFY